MMYDSERTEIKASNILILYQLIEHELELGNEDEAFCVFCRQPLTRERKNNYDFTNHTLEDCIGFLYEGLSYASKT